MWLYHIKYIKQIEYKTKIWFFLHFLGFRAIIVGVLYVIKMFMKKIFMQLWQRILKYKKKLVYGALALFIGQICFFWLWWIGLQNEVFADDGESQEQTIEKITSEKLPVLQLFNKIIYVCIYPILLVAWKVVDNSLVYWEVFWFDAVLWQLWGIVRNIANFALWFVFIFYIFKYLITQKEDFGPKKLIPKVFIAGIWIQASWFIMAALIDISTIMAYWVWWLPITVLKTDDSDSLKYNPYILNTIVSVDAKDVDSYHIYLSNMSGDQFISTCETFVYSATWENNERMEEELILSPKMVYYLSDNGECYQTRPDVCHIWDQVYKLGNAPEWEASYSTCDDLKEYQNNKNTDDAGYKVLYNNYSVNEIKEAISWGLVLRIWQTWNNFWLDERDQEIWPELWAPRIKDILSGSYAWVFTSLYGSLLNAWSDLRISNTDNSSLYVRLLNVALSWCHMIAIAIPLLVMVIVLVMRIWVLWMIIILSPVVVLLKVFEFDKKIDKDSILRFIQLDNLLWVVFAPVVICFAASLSTVLIRIILAVNWLNIETWKQDILWWLIQLDIAWVWINIWKLVWSVIWIAITWFLMWAAVKSSELWKTWIIKKIEEVSKSALWSMPLIPVPWKDWWVDYIWVDKAFGLNGQKWIISHIWDEIKNKYSTDSETTLNQRLDKNSASKEAETNRYNAYAKWLFNRSINEIQWNDWRAIPIPVGEWQNKKNLTFNSDLNDWQRKEIIDRINSLKDTKLREAYGWGVPTITIWGETWNFVKQKEEKDENGEVKKDKDWNVIMKDVYQYEQKENT